MSFASQIQVLRERLAIQLQRMEATLSLGGTSEGLRHTIEASALLKTVLSLLSSVGELERAWSIAGERSSVDVTVLEARLAEARGELASRADEVSRLRSALGAAENDADFARAETARAITDGETRATRAAESRAGELDAWKVSYADEMRRFGESRAAEAAAAARVTAEEIADAALRRLDSEARAAVSIAHARADTCASEAAAAARTAAAEEVRAVDAEARASAYADAASRAQADADTARAESADARAAAASLADEVLRARHLLSLERATADEVGRLFAERAAAEQSAAEALRVSALESEAARHGADIERLRAGFDAAVRAREESVSDWRARYAAAAARAEHAETLVKAIDRQLAPHAAAAALAPIASSLSNPALLARSWAAASSLANHNNNMMMSSPSSSSTSTSHHFGASSLADATMRSAIRSPPSSSSLSEPRNTQWSNATLRALAAGVERRSGDSALMTSTSSPSHINSIAATAASSSPEGVIYSDRANAAARLKSAQNHAVAAVAAVSSFASSMGMMPHSP
jgi:hypothetical protein